MAGASAPATVPDNKITLDKNAIEEVEKLRALYKKNTGENLSFSQVVASACATIRNDAEQRLKGQ